MVPRLLAQNSRRPGAQGITLLCDSPLTLQYIYKAYGLIELDRYLNTPFARPPEQRWLSLYSWFSKILAHFARLPYPRSAPQSRANGLKSTVFSSRLTQPYHYYHPNTKSCSASRTAPTLYYLTSPSILLPIRYADNFYKRAGRGGYIVLSHLLRGMDQEINRV